MFLDIYSLHSLNFLITILPDFSLSGISNIKVISDNMMLNIIAALKLSTLKLSTILEVSIIINAFRINKNNPNVKIVAGIVSMKSSGFTNVLSSDNTTATIIATI
jgi:hypothetical protein